MRRSEILAVIKETYEMAQHPGDKLMAKWLGWLAVFLSTNRATRLRVARDDKEIQETRDTLIEELYGLRKYQQKTRHIASNNRRVRNHSNITRSKLSKVTSKVREDS